MLESIYILLVCLASVFFMLSILKDHAIFFAWLSAVLFFFLGISSYSIEMPFCEAGNVTAAEWTCYTFTYTSSGLGYFWFGLGLIIFIYAMIMTIREVSSEIR